VGLVETNPEYLRVVKTKGLVIKKNFLMVVMKNNFLMDFMMEMLVSIKMAYEMDIFGIGDQIIDQTNFLTVEIEREMRISINSLVADCPRGRMENQEVGFVVETQEMDFVLEIKVKNQEMAFVVQNLVVGN
jgi:hypothetical protein